MMISCFLKLAAVFLSIFGYITFSHDKLKVSPAFAPLLSVSVISLGVYAAGLMGFLPYGTLFFLLFGIALFAYKAWRALRGKYSVREFVFSPATICFVLFSAFCVIKMSRMLLLHPDNFSHWAVILKEMCQTNAFPAEGTAVSFRNYPPGSACFAYFFCHFAGYTEGVGLIAHGVAVSAALSTVFCKIKLRDKAVFPLLSFAVMLFVLPELLSASLGIYNYLTDGIVGYVGAAGVIAAYYYRHDGKKLAVTLTPILAYLTIIKSSGRILAAIVTVLVIFLHFKKLIHPKKYLHCDKRGYIWLICANVSLVVSQFLTPYLWQVYVKLTFPAHVDKFPSSASGIVSAIAERNTEYVKNILSMIMRELFDFTSVTVCFTALAWVFAIFVIILTFVKKKDPSFIICAFFFCLVCRALYAIELFVLYAFIFPPEEAEILASFYRYYTTGVLFTVIPLTVAATHQLKNVSESFSPMRKRLIGTVIVIFCVAGLFTVRENLVQLYVPEYREDTAVYAKKRNELSEFYEDVSDTIPRDSYVLVYTDDGDFFHRNVVRLELLTSHYAFLSTADVSELSKLEEQLKLRKYIVADAENSLPLVSSCEALGYRVEGNGKIYVIDNEQKTVTATEK